MPLAMRQARIKSGTCLPRRRYRPVAELIPYIPRDAGKIRAAIETLKAFQETHTLAGLSVRPDDRRVMEVLIPLATLDIALGAAGRSAGLPVPRRR